MPLRTCCPVCGHEYELVDSLRGKYVRCEHCPESFRADPRSAPADTGSVAPNIPSPTNALDAVASQSAAHRDFVGRLTPGERVWAPWNRTTLFAGTVDQIQGNEAHIHFDDGDHGWVLTDQLMPLEIPIGLRVMGRWKMGGSFFPGTVTEVSADKVHIHYDDGDKEWARPAALALLCEPFGPDARPTRTATNWQPLAGWLVPVAIGIGIAFLRIGCR